MKKKIGIGLSAGFGGIAPNLFRLASGMTKGESLPEASYILGVLLFAMMGAATALALGETEARKALFLGLGLPAMFQSAAQDVSTAAARLELSPVAYASTVLEEPERKISILWNGDVSPESFSLIYRGSDERRRMKDDFVDPEELSVLYAPLWATGTQLVVGDVLKGPRSNWVDFRPGGEPLELVVTVEQRGLTGLRKAIGLRGVDEYAVTLELAEDDGK